MRKASKLTIKIRNMKINQVLTIPNEKLKHSDRWWILVTAKKNGAVVVTKKLNDCLKIWRCA